MAFNVRYKTEKYRYDYGTALLHFLPRIGEELNFSGTSYIVVNIIYNMKTGTYVGQDVDIIIKPK